VNRGPQKQGQKSAGLAGKTRFFPNYFCFCKSAFLGANAVLPSVGKGFFGVGRGVFGHAFCTHGGQRLFKRCV
jgi:hypothetical protein